MDKEKKFCFCITRRRVISAVILVASVLNLIIVGAAFDVTFPEAAPTATASPTVDVNTMTFGAPSATEGVPTFISLTPTDTPTPTATYTPTPTYTLTATPTYTPTSTNTPTPTATVCTPYYWWPIYFIQSGDTLFSIALKTGSTVDELTRANCWLGTRIYVGQKLYVPHLPIITPTFTPTYTPTTFVDTPTEFTLYNVMSCDPPSYVSFAVIAKDPEGVLSVMVQMYTIEGVLIGQIDMAPKGDVYYGSGAPLIKPYTVYDVEYYQFSAIDGLKNNTLSQVYRDRSSYCYPIPTPTATPTLAPVGLQEASEKAQ